MVHGLGEVVLFTCLILFTWPVLSTGDTGMSPLPDWYPVDQEAETEGDMARYTRERPNASNERYEDVREDGSLPRSTAHIRDFVVPWQPELSQASVLDMEHVVFNHGVVELHEGSEAMHIFFERQHYRLAEVQPCLPAGSGRGKGGLFVRVKVRKGKRESSSCVTIHNEISLFHAFSHPQNMYHAMNNNIMPLVTNLLLHPACTQHLECRYPVVLYTLATDDAFFRKALKVYMPAIRSLFDDVRSANEVLKGGAHCMRHVSWGRSPAYFIPPRIQKHALGALRPRFYNHIGLSPALAARRAEARRPRVIIVMRAPSARSLVGVSLRNVRWAGEGSGMEMAECCAWGQPLERTMRIIADASGVVGAHGAGLANVQFARRGAFMVDFIGTSQDRTIWGAKFVKLAATVGGPTVLVMGERANPREGIVVGRDTAIRAFECTREGENRLCGDRVERWNAEEGLVYAEQVRVGTKHRVPTYRVWDAENFSSRNYSSQV